MEAEKGKKLGLVSLICMVVGSMIGGGVFSLPADMSKGAGGAAIMIGWLVTGIGMIALALVYQNLAVRKPELNGGVYSYAKDGFGEYVGFNAAWGYWLSALLGNVSYAVMMFGALGYFFPVFGTGNNLISIVCASALVWFFCWLIGRGVKEAAFINVLTTIAKLVPLCIFLVCVMLAFRTDIFSLDLWGRADLSLGCVLGQVRSTMLVTLWVFIGVEGAVVISGRAQNRRDVGRATVIGLLGTLVLYILVSLLSLGVMTRAELAALPTPSTAYVLEMAVGKWGAALINFGLVLSLFGALLGWSMLAAEIPYVAAKDGVMPRVFAAANAKGAPLHSLVLTNVLVQAVLILTFYSSSTYQTLYSIASSAILIPYLFSGLYALKLALSGKTYEACSAGRTKDACIAFVSSAYAAWLVYAAGLQYLALVTILYALGIFIFVRVKKEAGVFVFQGFEKGLATLIGLAGIAALFLLTTGQLSV